MAIKRTRKTMALGLAVGVILLCVAGVSIWVYYQNSKPKTPVDQVPIAALSYTHKGDIKGGLAYFDRQIAEHKTADDKRTLLIAKSGYARVNNQNQAALDAATQADKIKSDATSLLALARAYEALGNKRQAADYYQKVLDASPKDGEESRYNPVYRHKIKELRS